MACQKALKKQAIAVIIPRHLPDRYTVTQGWPCLTTAQKGYEMPQTTLSGPELSVEVARCVMGWERAGIVNGKCYVPCGHGYWAPHEFIKDAWEVVEKDDGWGFNWRLKRWAASPKPWTCVADRITDSGRFYAEAVTAPLAICLVALRAVE